MSANKLRDFIDFNLLSFDVICSKIATEEHFSFARFGDGEFNAILGKQGANCDGHKYFKAMGETLGLILKSKVPYYVGLHENKKLQDETVEWLNKNGITQTFASNAVFHCATRDSLFDKFWTALKGKRVHIIAPSYVNSQNKIKAGFISVPAADTYRHLPAVSEKLACVDFTGSVNLICASMTAPILVDQLYQRYANTATFIDFGSSFDPIVGVKSRSFHKV